MACLTQQLAALWGQKDWPNSPETSGPEGQASGVIRLPVRSCVPAVISTESTSILVREFERLGDEQVGAQPWRSGLPCIVM